MNGITSLNGRKNQSKSTHGRANRLRTTIKDNASIAPKFMRAAAVHGVNP